MAVSPKLLSSSLLSIVALMTLSGCESSGSMRVASVGARGPAGPAGVVGPAGADGTNGTNGTNGTDGQNGTAGATGATGSVGAQGSIGIPGVIGLTGAVGATGPAGGVGVGALGALAVGGLVGPSGVAGTGLLANTGDPSATNPVVSGVLVATGGALQAVGGTSPNALIQPVVQIVDAALPGATPLTGTVTQVIQSTGQALVDTGNGTQYLVDGLTAAPGQLINLTVGAANAVGSTGTTPALGISVLSSTQSTGELLSVGVASGGQLLTLQPGASGGGAGGASTNAVDTVSGAVGGLLNVTAGQTTVIGSPTQTAALEVGVLSPGQPTGSVLGVGVASGGELLTLNPGSGGSGLGAVTSTVGAVVDTAANALGGATGSLPGAGSSPLAGITNTVQNAVGTVTGGGSTSPTAPVSGLLGGVTGALSGTTGGTTGGLGGLGGLLGHH